MQDTQHETVGGARLTIGEVAELVRGLAADPFTLIDKCRHWGKIGLLIAVDRQGEGTGRHRLYGVDAVYDAATLIVLADAGLHPGEVRWLADAVSKSRLALAKWQSARRRNKGRADPLFLDQFFIPAGKTIADARYTAAKSTALADIKRKRPDLFAKEAFAAITITIDLGRLFAHVEAAMAAKAAAQTETHFKGAKGTK